MKIAQDFFTPIVFANNRTTFTQKVVEACDDFFYYGGRKICVLADKTIYLTHNQKRAITALKIALCFTVVLPALCLIIKALFRPDIKITPLNTFNLLFSASYNEAKIKEYGLTSISLNKMQSLRTLINRMSEDELMTCQLKNQPFIQNADLQRLFGTNWLNDTCIDEYLKLLIRSHPDFCFCSVMMVKLALDKPEDRPLTLARMRTHDGQKLNWLPKKVLIPINTGLHWALMVLDTAAKTIHYYDSIAKRQLPASAQIIGSQLEKMVNCSLTVINSGQQCPQQTNSSDCGVFVILAASHVIKDKPLTYTQEDAPYMRAKILSDFCGFC